MNLSCSILSCPVLSCPVLSCPVLSCPVIFSHGHPLVTWGHGGNKYMHQLKITRPGITGWLCWHVCRQQDYRFFKSLQQTMLSRPLTEYAVTSSEARRLLLYMATSKAPDELYFPTLTQMDERFSSM